MHARYAGVSLVGRHAAPFVRLTKPSRKQPKNLMVGAHGSPLAVLVSAAKVQDWKMMLATVDAIEPIRAKTRARPRSRPHTLHADKGYDYRHLRLALRKRRIIPRIARRGVEPKNRMGRSRWVVERPLSWLNRFRRLKIRYERRADIHLAFLQLGCALISLRLLGYPRPPRENGRPGPRARPPLF